MLSKIDRHWVQSYIPDKAILQVMYISEIKKVHVQNNNNTNNNNYCCGRQRAAILFLQAVGFNLKVCQLQTRT